MKEHLKTAILILLGLSALYLLGRTWVYDSSLFGISAPEPEMYAPARLDYAPSAAAPARCAVMRGGMRTGAQYDARAGEVYELFKPLLAEALGSAGEAVDVPYEFGRTSILLRDGVYFEFSGQIPMPLLAAWLSADSGLDGEIEGIGLALREGESELFWTDAGGGFRIAATKIEKAQWPEWPELDPCAFAFETGYASVFSPLQLIYEDAPRKTVTASAPPDIRQELPLYTPFLEKLELTSSSTYSYLRGDTRVFGDVDSGRSCEISPDGTILFSAPGVSIRPDAPEGIQTLAGSVLRAWEAISLLEPTAGGGQFEVCRVTQQGGVVTVEWMLTAGGVPVLWEPGIITEVERGAIRRISLTLCRVTIGEEETVPMPLGQVAAMIPKGGGVRLDLRYAVRDGGQAVWAVRS